MRGGYLLLCAGVVVIAAAWREPQGQPVVRRVLIRFACENDGGATVTVRPWRVVLQRRTDHVEWTLIPTGVPSVAITPKYIAGWPFVAPPPVTVTAQSPGVARDVPAAVPGGNYKYNITGVCQRGTAPPDTVIIDPDMIIPTIPPG